MDKNWSSEGVQASASWLGPCCPALAVGRQGLPEVGLGMLLLTVAVPGGAAWSSSLAPGVVQRKAVPGLVNLLHQEYGQRSLHLRAAFSGRPALGASGLPPPCAPDWRAGVRPAPVSSRAELCQGPPTWLWDSRLRGLEPNLGPQ